MKKANDKFGIFHQNPKVQVTVTEYYENQKILTCEKLKLAHFCNLYFKK